MNVRDAILKAADQIEREPDRFSFSSYYKPDCRTPGCALGWIGFFLDMPSYRESGGYSKGFRAGLSAVASKVGFSGAESFYDAMEATSGGHGWMFSAEICAATLRKLAERHKGEQTFAEFMDSVMAVKVNINSDAEPLRVGIEQ